MSRPENLISPTRIERNNPKEKSAREIFRLFVGHDGYVTEAEINDAGMKLEESLSRLLRGAATDEDIDFLETGYADTADWENIGRIYRRDLSADRSTIVDQLGYIRSCNNVVRHGQGRYKEDDL